MNFWNNFFQWLPTAASWEACGDKAPPPKEADSAENNGEDDEKQSETGKSILIYSQLKAIFI